MNITDTKVNPPAFSRTDAAPPQPGMSLRDYFAAIALSGLVHREGVAPDITALRAYAFADAMLAHRCDDLFPNPPTDRLS